VTKFACGVREDLRIDLAPEIGKAVAVPEFPEVSTDALGWTRSLEVKDGALVGKSEFLLKVVELSSKQLTGQLLEY
jgi:hypothetical protein